MPFKIDTLQICVFCALLGAIAAILWSNITNKALSKFLNYLKNNDIDNVSISKKLSEMDIRGFRAALVIRKIKSSRVLKQYIGVVETNKDMDKLERFLSKTENMRFYLACDKDFIMQHNYISEPMPVNQLVISIVALILSGFIFVFGVQKAASCASPKTETSQKLSENQSALDSSDTQEEYQVPADDTNNEQNDVQDEQNTAPSIPMLS